MNILLTTRRVPEEKRNPISLLDLAGFLRGHGHTVDCYFLDQLAGTAAAKKRTYDLVGLSVLQVLDENAPVRDAVELKKLFNTKVVVGGKWTETMLEEQRSALQSSGVDICVGPGEEYFHPGKVDFGSYPSWSAVDFETLNEVNTEVMSSRGCPYHCNFCHNTETGLSFFSASRTADNIELLLKLGSERIFIVDDIFTMRAAHMAALLGELKKRGIDLENRCVFFSHVNHLAPEILEQIALYKPTQVQLGIESGDDRMLKLMGKTFASETALEKIKTLDRMGINVQLLFLVGFPGETEESLRNTLAFIERAEPFVSGAWMSYYQPVRGTKGYYLAIERVGRLGQSRRNTDITYVDPALTEELLAEYRGRMVKVFSRRSVKGFLRRGLIRNFHRISRIMEG